MNFVWFLIAAGVFSAVFALKKRLKSGEKRTLSPFQQSQPVPDRTSTPADNEGAAEPAPEKAASESAPDLIQPKVPQRRTPRQNVKTEGAAAPKTSALPVAVATATAATLSSAISADVMDRPSTWNDRRLFTDFHGILNEDAEVPPLPEDLPIRNEDFVFGSLTPSIAQLLPETDTRRETQRKSLLSAGYHSRASWLNLSAIRFVLSFLAVVILGFWLILAPPVVEPWLLGALVTVPLLMWALPPLVVAFKAAERKIDIERGLPDVLDMMNMGVSQGLTVPQSLRRISRELAEAHPALAEELHIVNQQAEVGNLSKALRNFGQRIDSPEVNSFTSLLVQSETTGTSISKALTDYSDSIRASLKERADARANAASFKLLFPVALFLMPSVFLFLLGPAIVQISDFVNNQADELQQDRQEALQSLDQQPQLNLDRFTAPGGAFQAGQQ